MILLDTCALIWLANGDSIADGALAEIERAIAAGNGGLLVSPVSAWEVGLASRRARRGRLPEPFLPDPGAWFARALAHPGVRLCPLTSAAAIASSELPGDFHEDPGDRLLVATSRALAAPIVTRDQKILAYAEAGHVAAIAC